MNLALALQYLFPQANPTRDFIVTDDRGVQTLLVWTLAEPQPTEGQLAAAWTAVQAKQVAAEALTAARSVMADAFASLPDEVRADHAADYGAIEACLIRGDVAAGKKRLERMTVSSAVPEAEREALRAQFLGMFPAEL